jgi:hypothetical protein
MEGVMSHSETLDLIVERAIAWGQDEVTDRYPNRVHFIPADAPGHGDSASAALAEGDPIVLVLPSGDEILIQPGENGDPVRIEARDSAGRALPT